MVELETRLGTSFCDEKEKGGPQRLVAKTEEVN